MTCTHVLGLIDAGPSAEYPRAHLEAAWRHARQCATCGPALEAARQLTRDLVALPYPAPPRDLTGDVLARITPVDVRVVPGATSMSEPLAASEAAARSFGSADLRDWPAWAIVIGCLVASLAVVRALAPGDWGLVDVMVHRAGGITADVAAIPGAPAGLLVLAAGLVLYLAGLLAPLGGEARRGVPP
jgi:hypothetical protein